MKPGSFNHRGHRVDYDGQAWTCKDQGILRQVVSMDAYYREEYSPACGHPGAYLFESVWNFFRQAGATYVARPVFDTEPVPDDAIY